MFRVDAYYPCMLCLVVDCTTMTQVISREEATRGAAAIRGAIGAFSAIYHHGQTPVPTTVVEVNMLMNGLIVDLMDAGVPVEAIHTQIDQLAEFYNKNKEQSRALEKGSSGVIVRP